MRSLYLRCPLWKPERWPDPNKPGSKPEERLPQEHQEIVVGLPDERLSSYLVELEQSGFPTCATQGCGRRLIPSYE